MTVYAAADRVYVGLSRAHGGCGSSHVRPVENGAPVKLWALTCDKCEDHLRHDDGWSGTIQEIPETYDEKIERERREKNASAEQEKALGNLPGNLAGALGPALAAALAPLLGLAQAQSVSCTAGHPNTAGVKFCGECGSPMGSLPGAVVPDASQAALSGPQRPATAPKAAGRVKPLKDWRADDLRAEARRLGLPADGDRAALIGRIKGAKVAA